MLTNGVGTVKTVGTAPIGFAPTLTTAPTASAATEATVRAAACVPTVPISARNAAACATSAASSASSAEWYVKSAVKYALTAANARTAMADLGSVILAIPAASVPGCVPSAAMSARTAPTFAPTAIPAWTAQAEISVLSAANVRTAVRTARDVEPARTVRTSVPTAEIAVRTVQLCARTAAGVRTAWMPSAPTAVPATTAPTGCVKTAITAATA